MHAIGALCFLSSVGVSFESQVHESGPPHVFPSKSNVWRRGLCSHFHSEPHHPPTPPLRTLNQALYWFCQKAAKYPVRGSPEFPFLPPLTSFPECGFDSCGWYVSSHVRNSHQNTPHQHLPPEQQKIFVLWSQRVQWSCVTKHQSTHHLEKEPC